MKAQIFISYRRTGGDVTAKLICEALKNKGYSVFYDYDSLKGGVFDSAILNSIDECNDFVLVLPKNALARCKSKDDWVRQEIRHALMRGKNIIPVMLEKFEFPKNLPDDIQAVTRYNGVRFHMDFFDSVIDKIVEKLTSRVEPKAFSTPITASIPITPPKANSELTDNVKSVVYLHVGQGLSSDIILYSPESSLGNIKKYDFTDEKWSEFSGIVKKVIACLFNTDASMVSVARKSPIGTKSCAPCDSLYFDEQYRIRFETNYIADNAPTGFYALHLDIGDGYAKLALFNEKGYVFSSVPDDTPMAYFGINEQNLLEAVKSLVTFAENKQDIIFASRFTNTVYSDKSGGYYLKYLCN